MAIQRVAIVGAGAMGGMYAAHFAAGGFDVGFVARGARAERLRGGLTVNGTLLRADVIDPDAATPADLALFAVKDFQLADALTDAAGVVGSGTPVLSVMNGLDSEERIAAAFPDADGVRFRQAGTLAFGRPDGVVDEVVAGVAAALDRAGLAWVTPPDMRHRLWWKFMVNVGINQASAMLRAPYGAFQSAGEARDLMWTLMGEVLLISAAEGVPLGDADLQAWDAVLANQPPAGMTSMHQDVEAGRRTEVASFAGRVVELGRRHGVPVPRNEEMLAWFGDMAT